MSPRARAPLRPSADHWFPRRPTLRTLAAAVDDCRACPLGERATQGVFGAGRAAAELMLVGEQPGEREDRTGQPFVGPAGALLDAALAAAGIDRALVYVTNVVKHFGFEERGQRRIHKTPKAGEIEACRPWLEQELALVGPKAVVCLGATAARAIVGPAVRITRDRGLVFPTTAAPWTLVTWHPSAVLRLEGQERERARRELVADLGLAAARLRQG